MPQEGPHRTEGPLPPLDGPGIQATPPPAAPAHVNSHVTFHGPTSPPNDFPLPPGLALGLQYLGAGWGGMEKPVMGAYSNCVSCGRKLRDAYFCRRCKHAACSWHCLDCHTAKHDTEAVSGDRVSSLPDGASAASKREEPCQQLVS
jgi:hypothetical protein